MNTVALVKVCATEDVPEGEARRFVVDGKEIAIVNLGEEGFRAVGDVCSHAEAYLHEGEVDVDFETIECPRHGSTFDLNTGKPRTLPATLPVPAYTVKVEGDDILIEVEE
ncbi:MAG: non-heme iron oxygenase ferredoxin subunit [Actinomycetota bacterium]|nr:non-heme iron oxygenase ferredoxin subunit [Actinomycetota bacterium]